MPPAESAVTTALAPGIGITRWPASRTACTTRAPGRARVGHERHALARPEEGCDLLGALHFVVFPNGEQTNVDAEFVKQLARLSGILSYYGVSTGENPQGT